MLKHTPRVRQFVKELHRRNEKRRELRAFAKGHQAIAPTAAAAEPSVSSPSHKIYEDPPQVMASPTTATTSSAASTVLRRGWECPACTFHNRSREKLCGMCQTERPLLMEALELLPVSSRKKRLSPSSCQYSAKKNKQTHCNTRRPKPDSRNDENNEVQTTTTPTVQGKPLQTDAPPKPQMKAQAVDSVQQQQQYVKSPASTNTRASNKDTSENELRQQQSSARPPTAHQPSEQLVTTTTNVSAAAAATTATSATTAIGSHPDDTLLRLDQELHEAQRLACQADTHLTAQHLLMEQLTKMIQDAQAAYNKVHAEKMGRQATVQRLEQEIEQRKLTAMHRVPPPPPLAPVETLTPAPKRSFSVFPVPKSRHSTDSKASQSTLSSMDTPVPDEAAGAPGAAATRSSRTEIAPPPLSSESTQTRDPDLVNLFPPTSVAAMTNPPPPGSKRSSESEETDSSRRITMEKQFGAAPNKQHTPPAAPSAAAPLEKPAAWNRNNSIQPLANTTNRREVPWISNAPARQFMREMDEAAQARPSPTRKAADHPTISRRPGRSSPQWHASRNRAAAMVDDERIKNSGSTDLWRDDDDEPNYPYQEVVRCKAKRQGLPCHDCPKCRRFYEVVREQEGIDDPIVFSRHRARFIPNETPEDFWVVDFIDERDAQLAKEAEESAVAAAAAAEGKGQS